MKTEFSVGKIGQVAMSLLQAHGKRKDAYQDKMNVKQDPSRLVGKSNSRLREGINNFV